MNVIMFLRIIESKVYQVTHKVIVKSDRNHANMKIIYVDIYKSIINISKFLIF